MDTTTRDAIAARLDTRCARWQFGVAYAQQRCGTCDGCVCARWADTTLTNA